MHEMALAESMLEIVETRRARQRRARVASVRLEIGALSHVEPQALRFCFDAVTRGSVAEGRALEIVTTAGRGMVHAVRRDAFRWSRSAMRAPSAAAISSQVVGGEEMRVREIAVA